MMSASEGVMEHASLRVSVCMATFNGERYVAQQVESILPQLGSDDELVVSDDSSCDATLEIIRSFQDSRVRLLPNNRFASPIFNFENALRAASKDILVLSDQDDVWLPNKITLIRERFARRRPDAFAVVLDGVVTDSEGHELWPSLFQKMGSGPGILKNIYDNTFLGCCMAFSREALELALPFPRRIPMHDMWIGLVASAFGQVEFIPEKTILYRKHAHSLTDFRREFRPLTQIQRRFFLSASLALRVFSRRSAFGGGR